MSYPFDRTQIVTAQAVASLQTARPRRRLSRRIARQMRREARAI